MCVTQIMEAMGEQERIKKEKKEETDNGNK